MKVDSGTGGRLGQIEVDKREDGICRYLSRNLKSESKKIP